MRRNVCILGAAVLSLGLYGAEGRLWRFTASEALAGPPVLAGDGSLLFATEGGRLFQVGPEGRAGWESRVAGEVLSPPVLFHGNLAVASDKRRLAAFRASDGNLAFEADLAAVPATPLAVTSGGLLVLGGRNGTLYGFGAQGAEKWHLDLGAPLGPPAAGTEGRIFVMSGHSLACAGETGNLYWKASLGAFSAVPMAVDGAGRVFLVLDGSLYAYGANGGLLWRSSEAVRAVPPVVFGGSTSPRVAVAARDREDLLCLDAATGNLLWSLSEANGGRAYLPAGAPAADGTDRLVLPDASGRLLWVNGSDGTVEEEWAFPSPEGDLLLGWAGLSGRLVVRGGAGGRTFSVFSVPCGQGSPWSQAGGGPFHLCRLDLAPAWTIFSPEEGEEVSEVLRAEGAVTDDLDLPNPDLFLDGQLLRSFDTASPLWEAKTAVFEEGAYLLTFLARDSAGNASLENRSFEVRHTSSPLLEEADGPPLFAWHPSEDPGERYRVQVALDPAFATVVMESPRKGKGKWLSAAQWRPGETRWKKVKEAAGRSTGNPVTFWWRVVEKGGGARPGLSFDYRKPS